MRSSPSPKMTNCDTLDVPRKLTLAKFGFLSIFVQPRDKKPSIFGMGRVRSLNPDQVELGVRSTSVLSRTWTKNIIIYVISVLKIIKAEVSLCSLWNFELCHAESRNGPQLVSNELTAFTEFCDYENFASSPWHPEGNSKLKLHLSKESECRLSVKNLKWSSACCLEIRNTPQQHARFSPAQRLLNHRTRTLISVTTKVLYPQGNAVWNYTFKLLVKSTTKLGKHYFSRKVTWQG